MLERGQGANGAVWSTAVPPEIKLVALDLDGTLLGRDGRVPQRNIEAIATARAQGVTVIIATGKTRFSALHVIDTLQLDAPGVFSQGLIVCDAAGEILREVRMERNLVQELVDYLERAEMPHSVYTREGLFAPVSDYYSDLIHTKYGEPLPQVVGPLAQRQEMLQVNKVIIGNPAGDGQLRRVMEAEFGDRLTVTQAVPEYVELFAHGASKGAGVAWLLDHLGIAPKAMLAAGDGDNDLEMLRLAGIGVALANARPGVKAAADFVVCSNDDGGVAEALEHFVLR
jgi:Cof subfamily protein (haloacid dehalogenase superfamily)